MALGYILDSPEIARRAAQYLETRGSQMDCMGLRLPRNPEIANQSQPGQLHANDFDAVLPASLATHRSEVVHGSPGPNIVPIDLGKSGSNLPGARIGNCIFEIGYTHEGLLYVRDFPRDNGIESNTLSVSGHGCEAQKVIRTGRDVLMKDLVKMQRPDPVEPRTQNALEFTQPTEDACFEGVEHDERNQRLEDRLDDLENSVKHGRFLLEGRF
jgi:hypothetical protein